MTNEHEIKKKDVLYYAQILPSVGIYHVLEMKVATVYDTDKHRYLFNYTDVNKSIFFDRSECLEKVKYADAHGKKVSNETYYEED